MNLCCNRPRQGGVHPHHSVLAVPPGRSGAVLHQVQPPAAVRDLDQGQAASRALPDQGHRHHEQRLTPLHQGMS